MDENECELNSEVFNQPNLQIFVLDHSLLLTFLTLPYSNQTDDKFVFVKGGGGGGDENTDNNHINRFNLNSNQLNNKPNLITG